MHLCHCGINLRENLELSDDISTERSLNKVDRSKLCIFLDLPLSYDASFHSPLLPQKEESSGFSHKMEGAGKMGGVGGLSYKRVIITYFQTNPS